MLCNATRCGLSLVLENDWQPELIGADQCYSQKFI